MAEESQFHMTVVTQKRVHRGEDSHSPREDGHTRTDSPEQQAGAESAWTAPDEASKPVPVEHISHHRRYLDYGTVDLGSLDDVSVPEQKIASEHADAALSQGERQQEFLNKYDPALNRRYFTRNREKVTRYVLIALLAALVLIVGLFALSSFTGSGTETLEAPEVSTIPLETLDLG